MNKTLFAILALFLAVSARHLSHYAEAPYYSNEYPSHYSNEYPSHAYYDDEYPSHAYYDEKYPSHYDDDEYYHEQGSGMKSLFDALKNDPTASKYLKSAPKDEKSYK
jgi:hypothetical protein